jgi:putative transposase
MNQGKLSYLSLPNQVFRCARILITGIDMMHMIRKGQIGGPEAEVSSAANQFYSLAF